MHRVVITAFAKESFQQIIDYYKIKAGVAVAEKIKANIKQSLLLLKNENIDFQEVEFLKPI
jgi:plasmid stabilization system protein ParE